MELQKITIDVVSDVVCPWCFIGKKRLEMAIQEWNKTLVEVNWHPFQLNPETTFEGIPRIEYLYNKFGGEERVRPMLENLKNIGKEVGISFNFESNQLSMSTFHLHKLVYIAKKEDVANELHDRLFSEYFEKGTHLNNKENLYTIMQKFAWEPAKVDEVLESIEISNAVTKELKHYRQMGVTGVPFFIINNKYSVYGAHPKETFLEVFEKVIHN